MTSHSAGTEQEKKSEIEIRNRKEVRFKRAKVPGNKRVVVSCLPSGCCLVPSSSHVVAIAKQRTYQCENSQKCD